jgi:hypothetical protein
MHYADASELVAEIVAHKHPCDPDCLCWRLRTVPEIKAALDKMGVKDQELKNSHSC